MSALFNESDKKVKKTVRKRENYKPLNIHIEATDEHGKPLFSEDFHMDEHGLLKPVKSKKFRKKSAKNQKHRKVY